MSYQPRDYYWKRNGLRWEVWTAIGLTHFRLEKMKFWRERTAAYVANEIFAAYLDGREAEKTRLCSQITSNLEMKTAITTGKNGE